MTGARSRWNPWPIGIILWFVVFIGLCVGFVFKSFGMKHDMVTDHYYEKGLDHDIRQAAKARAKQLDPPPRIDIDTVKHRLIIHTPPVANGAVLEMYRPSDASLDRKYGLQNSGLSALSTLDLHPGLWEARISWDQDNEHYLHVEKVFIQ